MVIVGLSREARIVGTDARVLIGGRGLGLDLVEKPAALLSFGLCGALGSRSSRSAICCLAKRSIPDSFSIWRADAAWTDQLAIAVAGSEAGRYCRWRRDRRQSPSQGSEGRDRSVAVDMESHLVAKAAERLRVPFAVLRSVSDRDDQFSPPRPKLAVDGRPNVAAVFRSLLARPLQLPALIRTAVHAETAFKTLGDCRNAFHWRPAIDEIREAA